MQCLRPPLFWAPVVILTSGRGRRELLPSFTQFLHFNPHLQSARSRPRQSPFPFPTSRVFAGSKRLRKELDDQAERRAKWSRRRQFWEAADVDYINERNKVFNDKIKRAFDPYTREIKQNLERGTAL